MIYLVMAAAGAAVGWYASKYMGMPYGMALCIVIGIVGGLIGGAIATLFTFAAVILFKVLLAAIGAYMLMMLVQRYVKPR